MGKVLIGGILNFTFISILLFAINRDGANSSLVIAVLAFAEILWCTTYLTNTYKQNINNYLYNVNLKELKAENANLKQNLKDNGIDLNKK